MIGTVLWRFLQQPRLAAAASVAVAMLVCCVAPIMR